MGESTHCDSDGVVTHSYRKIIGSLGE